jgi:hypothetical protein
MPRRTVHRFRTGPVVIHQKRTNDVLQKPDNLKSYRQEHSMAGIDSDIGGG